jgi:hypothetical protein
MSKGVMQTFRVDPSALNLSSGVVAGIFSTILHVCTGVLASNKMVQLPVSDDCCFTFEEIGERALLREDSDFFSSLQGVTDGSSDAEDSNFFSSLQGVTGGSSAAEKSLHVRLT